MTQTQWEVEKITLTAQMQVIQQELAYLRPNHNWRHVEDRPLVKSTAGLWEVTADGEHEFIAAVPYCMPQSGETKVLWWIRHCVIENGHLCIVGDDDNEIAGWEVDDVEYWMPWPTEPKI